MVSHGYQSCRECHVSVAGGNLSNYGRLAAKSILPTWEGDELIISTPAWLSLGGHIRALQTMRDTKVAKSGKFFLMQAEASLSIVKSDLELTTTYGKDGLRDAYVKQNFGNLWFRAGRFLPLYGLTLENHTTIRRQLGYGENTERLNVEMGFEDDHVDAAITLTEDYDVVNRLGVKLGKDIGIAGLSARLGKYPVSGAWLILGHDPLTLTAELDYDYRRQFLKYVRLDWEIIQGLHLYALNVGAGLNWFPKPHWQLQVEVNSELAWALIHFYW